MNPLKYLTQSLRLIKTQYFPSYIILNLLFYGSIAIAMAAVAAHPEIQTNLLHALKQDLQSPTMAPVVNAYKDQHEIRAAAITLLVNLFIGTFAEINLPSLIIPFFGIAFGMFRAILWGIIFGPTPNGPFSTLATHWPVMLLEGQGYVLGMLSVYIHGKAFLKPATISATTHWQGYKRGLADSLKIYPLIILILAISAAYEAVEVIHFAHR